MDVQLPRAFQPQGRLNFIQHPGEGLRPVHRALAGRVEVGEINAGQEGFIQQRQAQHLVQRAQHAQAAHGFQAQPDVRKAATHQGAPRLHKPARAKLHRLFPALALGGADMHNDAPAAHQIQQPRGIQDVVDALLSQAGVGVGQVDVIGRVRAERHIRVLCRPADEPGCLF